MAALLAGGILIVVITALDVVLTILHPSRRGPITTALGRGTFEAMRLPARALDRPNLLSGAGAAATVVNVVGWFMLLWVGYALIYLAFVDDLSYAPSVTYADRDFWEALYFSGMSLTTVGFGDVVGETDALRILSVLEAATGFGVMTAAITYVLSILPRVSAARAAARSVETQADDASMAADLARDASYLISLHQQILEIDEETERFPILYYFHSEAPRASMYTFFRGVIVVCLQCSWGLSPDAVPHARRHGQQLQQAIHNTIDHFAVRFMHGKGPEALDRPLDDGEARRLLEAFARAASEAGVDPALTPAEELGELARFAGLCEAYLERIADEHLKSHRPLVEAAA